MLDQVQECQRQDPARRPAAAVLRLVDVVVAFPFYVLIIAQVFVVGTGRAAQVIDHPVHPYTRRLIQAVPRLRRHIPAGSGPAPSRMKDPG